MNKKLKLILPAAGIVLMAAVLIMLVTLSDKLAVSLWEQSVADCSALTGEKAAALSSVIDKDASDTDKFVAFATEAYSVFGDEYDAFSATCAVAQNTEAARVVYFLEDGRMYDALTSVNGATVTEDASSALTPIAEAGVDTISPVITGADGTKQIIIYRTNPDKNSVVTAAAAYYRVTEIYASCNFTDTAGSMFYFTDKTGEILFCEQSEDVGANITKILIRGGFPTDTADDVILDMQSGVASDYRVSGISRGDRSAASSGAVGTGGDLYAITVTPYTQEVIDGLSDINATVIISAVILGLFVVSLIVIWLGERTFRKKLKQSESRDKTANCNNQDMFVSEARRLIESRQSTRYAVVYANIRNFRYINRIYGFAAANDLVYKVSAVVKSVLTFEETYGRMFDGRIVLLLAYVVREDIPSRLAELIRATSNIMLGDQNTVSARLSFGIMPVSDENKQSIVEMIDGASFAAQSISDDSTATYAYYSDESHERILQIAKIEEHMADALKDREFEVYYQPKYNILQGRIDGAEALIRWTGSSVDIVSPDKFIPQFEKNGFIAEIDRFVLSEVCAMICRHRDTGQRVIPISVNVSHVSLRRPDFVDFYVAMKKKNEIPDGIIELEFTESVAVENYVFLREVIGSLHEAGYRCSIDDFGSGYSSFKALKEVPFDVIKLDKLFLDHIEGDERGLDMLTGVIKLVKSLEMKTIMEGVETEKELSLLKQLGCDAIQGYLYSKPIPLEDFERFKERAFERKNRPGI